MCVREREKSIHMIKVEEETVKNRLYNIGIQIKAKIDGIAMQTAEDGIRPTDMR